MCVAAKDHFSLPFIDPDEEPEVNEYKFEYDDVYRTRDAMTCPTIPAIFLRPGDTVDEILVSFVKSTADQFDYDVDYDVLSVELGKNIPSLLIEILTHYLRIFLSFHSRKRR